MVILWFEILLLLIICMHAVYWTGMFFQLVLSLGIWITGFIVQCSRGFPTFYPLPMLGGFFWTTVRTLIYEFVELLIFVLQGNLNTVLIIKMINLKNHLYSQQISTLTRSSNQWIHHLWGKCHVGKIYSMKILWNLLTIHLIKQIVTVWCLILKPNLLNTTLELFNWISLNFFHLQLHFPQSNYVN